MPIARNLQGSGLQSLAAAAIIGTLGDALTATGTTQATAALISTDRAIFTTVPAGSGARLPVGGENDTYQIMNDSAVDLLLYPPVNGSINGGAQNAPMTVSAGQSVKVFYQDYLTIRLDILPFIPGQTPATLQQLAAGNGSSLVTFTQAGTGATPRSMESKLREHVSIDDFFVAGESNSTSMIQRALDAHANNVTIYGGGKSYQTTGPVYIRGNQKTLDFEGGQLVLDTVAANQSAVVIDNPTATPTAYAALKNVRIYCSDAAKAAIGTVGVLIKDGVLHPVTENVGLQGFGQSSGNGFGMAIRGGPVGSSDTPYYGIHTNLKAQFCHIGVYVGAATGFPIITTQTFINPTVGGCVSHGIYFYNAQSCTLLAPHLEQNGGANLRWEKCGECYSFGGFNEGGSPNVQYIDTNPNFGHIVLSNMYPSEPAGTGTRVATYYDNPALGMQGNAILLERASSMQVMFGTAEIMELKFPGLLTVQTDQNTFARCYLSGGAVELIESGGANAALWTTVKNTAAKINVYYDTGKYYLQNNTGGGIACRLFTQVGF